MKRIYETPIVEMDKVNADIITTSDWELPKIDWETEKEKEQNDW